MVVADPSLRSCLSVAGNGSASKGLAMEKLAGFNWEMLLAINTGLAFLWFVSPKIDQVINEKLIEKEVIIAEGITFLETEVKSDFRNDIPSLIMILNLALLVTFIGARMYING